MFIRSTSKTDLKTSKKYCSYQLVESYRTENGPRQRIILTIDNATTFTPEERKLLANRIEEICSGIDSFILLPLHIEELAHSFAKQVIQNKNKKNETKEPEQKQFISIDIKNLQHERARSVGLEHICFETINKLGLEKLFQNLDFTDRQIEVIIGVIIARLAGCGSELESYQWLKDKTALEELLNTDYSRLSKNTVYEASDLLIKHKEKIESHLIDTETQLFNLDNTIVLYDLTNTYFEGRAEGVEKAKQGRSKEKRSGSPLVTLGLALNTSGFPLKSDIFEGNISEPATLKQVIQNLNNNGTKNPIVVLDAGIATEKNREWLRENHYSYLVCSKNKTEFSNDLSFEVVNKRNGKTVKAARIDDPEGIETILVCHSEEKEASEVHWQKATQKKFEKELIYLNDGLCKKGRMKNYQKVCEKIGRLKNSYSRISQYYKIHVETDVDKLQATKIIWEIDQDSINTRFSGHYCLRAYGLDWSDSRLWHTYVMLTRVEDAFRCLKSEIGLRPIYHQKDSRVDGHLFITLLSYHIIQVIQHKLRQCDIHMSWSRIRKEMATQVRVTTAMTTEKGELLRVRGTTNPEPMHQAIYKALQLSYKPSKTVTSFY
jgi:transposase